MTEPADPRVKQLSGPVRAIAERLGYDVGIKFMTEFGGQQISIPKRPMPRTSVVWKKLGEDVAKLLSELYPPGPLEIPNGGPMRKLERNRAIADHPGSHNVAAREFGVTRRWVRMVRKVNKEGPGPLFEGLSKRS
jgi:hypothetical protein